MKNLIEHMKKCSSGNTCTRPHCSSSRQILSHWRSCANSECPMCGSLRKTVPQYLNRIVQNSSLRAELLRRFKWIFALIGSPSLRSVQQLHEEDLRRFPNQCVKKTEE